MQLSLALHSPVIDRRSPRHQTEFTRPQGPSSSHPHLALAGHSVPVLPRGRERLSKRGIRFRGHAGRRGSFKLVAKPFGFNEHRGVICARFVLRLANDNLIPGLPITNMGRIRPAVHIYNWRFSSRVAPPVICVDPRSLLQPPKRDDGPGLAVPAERCPRPDVRARTEQRFGWR